MPLLSCQNLSVSYAQREIIRDVTFNIEKGDKIGLIGANGSGKTTLFNALTGKTDLSEGRIFCAAGTRIGTVEQHSLSGSELTVFAELLTVFDHLKELEKQIDSINRKIHLTDGNVSEYLEKQAALTEEYNDRGGLTYVARTHSALAGLGFSKADEELPVSALSGGQRTKLSLGKLLLSSPDIMLLDEPTNHLDINSVEWLEDFLSKISSSLIVVSHDRYFLDKVTSKTMEISGKRLYTGKGSYSVYMKNKALRLESDRREYEKGMTEIKRIEKMIEQQKQFNQERNYVTIASKQKQIERIRAQLPELPPKEYGFKLRFGDVERSGDNVLYVENLKKGYDGKLLFSDVSFTVHRGEKVFLLGPNGCGKSTMLSLIMNKQPRDAGYTAFGQNVKVGYFEQNQRGLMTDKTVLYEIYDRFPRLTVPEIRSYLGAFNFRNDDIEKKMRDLSGGERARVALLILILSSPNFLILDEPTNHLDAASREVLEEALENFEGTLLCVSHDRYFVNRIATKILTFRGTDIVVTEGNYDDSIAYFAAPVQAQRRTVRKTNDYALRKEQERTERKRLSRIAKIENELAQINEEKEKTAELLGSPDVSADYEKVIELTGKLSELGERAEELENEWLELSEG